ncbi:hypothetical protein CLV62_1316 [Dysgonomonas alginatilytica]|uniref:Uncharacterized protein n=1 Tax=Dysgonomonas alginatilytica TaxID=1605892 RepID=A0A2V3PKY0_9BACT|nr:hypothetical protein CLV62_1316 [Dysgonomonas alginatilytica]
MEKRIYYSLINITLKLDNNEISVHIVLLCINWV